jgi:hypothetical protein
VSNSLSDSWGDFLGQFHWDWFVTLTFEGDVKTFTARNRCNAWLRSLEKAAGQPIAWFRGDEYGEKFGKFHMHLLISNVAELHRFTWMARWKARNGIARIFPFDPTRGAAFYVSAYVTKQFGEWEMSNNISAFRTGQTALELLGQRGSPDSECLSQSSLEKPSRRKRKRGITQIPIPGFKEPDLREIDTDDIRSTFREQTKRKR